MAAALLSLSVATTSLAGCGSDGKKVSASKTKIAQQLGLASGTARAQLLDPAVVSVYTHKGPNQKAAMAKAAGAAEYTVRALVAAQNEAAKQGSLKALSQQIGGASASIGALTVVLRNGQRAPKSLVKGSRNTIQSVINAAADNGIKVTDQVAPDSDISPLAGLATNPEN